MRWKQVWVPSSIFLHWKPQKKCFCLLKKNNNKTAPKTSSYLQSCVQSLYAISLFSVLKNEQKLHTNTIICFISQFKTVLQKQNLTFRLFQIIDIERALKIMLLEECRLSWNPVYAEWSISSPGWEWCPHLCMERRAWGGLLVVHWPLHQCWRMAAKHCKHLELLSIC